MTEKLYTQSDLEKAIAAAIASLTPDIPDTTSAPPETSAPPACECYAVTTAAKCKNPAKAVRKTRRGREINVCAVHMSAKHVYTSLAGAKKAQARKEADFKAMCQHTAERKQAREQAGPRPQVESTWLTLDNLLERVADLPSGEHKVMGVGNTAWQAWISAHGEDVVWADNTGSCVLAGAGVGLVRGSGKQGKASDDMVRGIIIA